MTSFVVHPFRVEVVLMRTDRRAEAKTFRAKLIQCLPTTI
jgi:hypothetical protein